MKKEKKEFIDSLFTANDKKAFFSRLEKIDRFFEEKQRLEELEKAEDKGRTEGIDIGRSEGIDIGRNEGMNNATEAIIKNLLHNNVAIEIISKSSGKTIEDVLKIKNGLAM